MPKFGLVGSQYTPKSLIADSQTLMNMYPEVVESGLGRGGTTLYLIGTQGLKQKYTTKFGAITRSFINVPSVYPAADRMFVVAGNRFYELPIHTPGSSADSVDVYSGTETSVTGEDSTLARIVNGDQRPVYMATDGVDILIAADKKMYKFVLASNTFSGPLTDTEGFELAPLSVVWQNGAFLYHTATDIFFSSENTSTGAMEFGPLDRFGADAHPDNILRLVVHSSILWAFGGSTIQPYQNTGDELNPWTPIQSGVIQLGIDAPDSVQVVGNSLVWLGADPQRGGSGMWRNAGYSAERISNHGLETVLEGYNHEARKLAQSYSFTDEGHQIYQISFTDPRISATWRYDALLPRELAWYQVGCWNQTKMAFEAHHSVGHAYAFGMHLVGDRAGACCGSDSIPGGTPATVYQPLMPFGGISTAYMAFSLAGVPFAQTPTIGASGDKHAYIIRVPKTGTLRSFYITNASSDQLGAGSTVRFSFQGVSTTTGDPNGTISHYKNAAWNDVPPGTLPRWFSIEPMTSDGTAVGSLLEVTEGQLLACVIDWTVYTGSDLLGVRAWGAPSGDNWNQLCYMTNYSASGAAWTKSAHTPSFGLLYDDGTYGYIPGWVGAQSVETNTFNNASTNDEIGLRFTVPAKCKMNGAMVRIDLDGPCDIVLYDSDGTTALATTSLIAGARVATTGLWGWVPLVEQTLSADTAYRLVVKPTSTTSVVIYGWVTANQLALSLFQGNGQEWYQTKRADAAATWTDDSTRQPLIYPIFSAFS